MSELNEHRLAVRADWQKLSMEEKLADLMDRVWRLENERAQEARLRQQQLRALCAHPYLNS